MSAPAEPLLRIRGLKKYFPVKKGIFNRVSGAVKAVDGLNFDVYPNETIGLVGESGCGKTTAGRSILRLIEPSEGQIFYGDTDIVQADTGEMRRLRRNLQIIFQDPYSSLNPRMTIEDIIGEAIVYHGIEKGDLKVRRMVQGLLERVGLQPSYVTRYPHEFSGGQRQRIGIARALALSPDFIVCDEAVSALDVSVQAQVINLLLDLQDEFNLSYLFIAHDLSVVRHISDRIAVMYLGQIMELADKTALFSHALHPYTQALLSAIPEPNPRRKIDRVILKGDVPSPMNPPQGCRFHTRCPASFDACSNVEPQTISPVPGHVVKCHLYDPYYAPRNHAAWEKLPKLPPADSVQHLPPEVVAVIAELAPASGVVNGRDAQEEDTALADPPEQIDEEEDVEFPGDESDIDDLPGTTDEVSDSDQDEFDDPADEETDGESDIIEEETSDKAPDS